MPKNRLHVRPGDELVVHTSDDRGLTFEVIGDGTLSAVSPFDDPWGKSAPSPIRGTLLEVDVEYRLPNVPTFLRVESDGTLNIRQPGDEQSTVDGGVPVHLRWHDDEVDNIVSMLGKARKWVLDTRTKAVPGLEADRWHDRLDTLSDILAGEDEPVAGVTERGLKSMFQSTVDDAVDGPRANLGLATTKELVQEIAARYEVGGDSMHPDYTTVGGDSDPAVTMDLGPGEIRIGDQTYQTIGGTLSYNDVESGQTYSQKTDWRFLDTTGYRALSEGRSPYDKMRTLMQLAVGAASRCWTGPFGTGVFDSDSAGIICDDSLSFVFDVIMPEYHDQRKRDDDVKQAHINETRSTLDGVGRRFQVETNVTQVEVSVNGLSLGKLTRIGSTDMWTSAAPGSFGLRTPSKELHEAIGALIDRKLPLGVDKRGSDDMHIRFVEPTLHLPQPSTVDDDDEEEDDEV
jgi:hypothetical protein